MCRTNDLIENSLPDTATKKGRARAHRLDLGGVWVQFLQCSAPAQDAVQPRTPEGDTRRSQLFDGKRMHVAGRGIAVHAREMFGYERLDLSRRKVILADIDIHGAL